MCAIIAPISNGILKLKLSLSVLAWVLELVLSQGWCRVLGWFAVQQLALVVVPVLVWCEAVRL
jgi:hypothetical protein